ncbi:MAG: hypothetical protein HOW73_14640 [Polyangiaceae bacterium]|nr:hypothetical protein [Polyangiaceae bacterium]
MSLLSRDRLVFSLIVAGAFSGCRGEEFQSSSGGAGGGGSGGEGAAQQGGGGSGANGGAGGSGGQGVGGAEVGGSGGSGGGPTEELLDVDVTVVGIAGNLLADRPVLVAGADGIAEEADVTNANGAATVQVPEDGSVIALTREGVAVVAYMAPGVTTMKLVDPFEGGVTSTVALEIVGHCADCTPLGYIEYFASCRSLETESGQTVNVSHTFADYGGCTSVNAGDFGAVAYNQDGSYRAVAHNFNTSFQSGTVDIGEFLSEGTSPTTNLNVSFAGLTAGDSWTMTVKRLNGFATTTMMKETGTTPTPSDKLYFPLSLLNDGYVFQEVEQADNRSQLQIKPYEGVPGFTFTLDQLGDVDGSFVGGTPSQVHLTVTGAQGDALFTELSGSGGGAWGVWAPAAADATLQLPQLPPGYEAWALGATVGMRVTLLDLGGVAGYAQATAAGTARYHANVISRTTSGLGD